MSNVIPNALLLTLFLGLSHSTQAAVSSCQELQSVDPNACTAINQQKSDLNAKYMTPHPNIDDYLPGKFPGDIFPSGYPWGNAPSAPSNTGSISGGTGGTSDTGGTGGTSDTGGTFQ